MKEEYEPGIKPVKFDPTKPTKIFGQKQFMNDPNQIDMSKVNRIDASGMVKLPPTKIEDIAIFRKLSEVQPNDLQEAEESGRMLVVFLDIDQEKFVKYDHPTNIKGYPVMNFAYDDSIEEFDKLLAPYNLKTSSLAILYESRELSYEDFKTLMTDWLLETQKDHEKGMWTLEHKSLKP